MKAEVHFGSMVVIMGKLRFGYVRGLSLSLFPSRTHINNPKHFSSIAGIIEVAEYAASRH